MYVCSRVQRRRIFSKLNHNNNKWTTGQAAGHRPHTTECVSNFSLRQGPLMEGQIGHFFSSSSSNKTIAWRGPLSASHLDAGSVCHHRGPLIILMMRSAIGQKTKDRKKLEEVYTQNICGRWWNNGHGHGRRNFRKYTPLNSDHFSFFLYFSCFFFLACVWFVWFLLHARDHDHAQCVDCGENM